MFILHKCLSVAIVAVGMVPLYYAGLFVTLGIWPQWRESGLSLSGNNMILNREWSGNELYLVVLLYGAVGLIFAACGVILWRKRPRIQKAVEPATEA